MLSNLNNRYYFTNIILQMLQLHKNLINLFLIFMLKKYYRNTQEDTK